MGKTTTKKKPTATKKKSSATENELQKEEDRINKKKQDEERDERLVQRILKKEDKEEPQIKFIGKTERFDKIAQRYRNDPIASAQWVNILNSNDDENDYSLTDKQLRQLNTKLELPTENFKDGKLIRGKAKKELIDFLKRDTANAKELKSLIVGGFLNKNTKINSLFK